MLMLPRQWQILDRIWSTTVSGFQPSSQVSSWYGLLRNLTGLLYPAQDDEDEADARQKEEVGEELEKQLKELQIVVGLRCLSVLRYLTDHTGVLSLGVLARWCGLGCFLGPECGSFQRCKTPFEKHRCKVGPSKISTKLCSFSETDMRLICLCEHHKGSLNPGALDTLW